MAPLEVILVFACCAIALTLPFMKFISEIEYVNRYSMSVY
jgi:hypothetical protein